ncbi:MAG: hypothetical protein KBC38_04065 [Candidatus Pacebacteria bacterium]|nr:hypothetical protein [Candidatus Paceibacterota bacterium]MBP9840384.1 hypothetical protein [Candidatus Paceibacterota bacterium]
MSNARYLWYLQQAADIKRKLLYLGVLKAAPRGEQLDQETFAVIIASSFSYGIAPEMLADDFGVSFSAVERWSRGQTVPIALIRDVIVDGIINRLKATDTPEEIATRLHEVSECCEGEICHINSCAKPASHKIGEEIHDDDPYPGRHNFTAYVCCDHLAEVFGTAAADSCAVNSLERAGAKAYEE